MKEFFKFMFASMLGTFLASFALFFVGFLIIAGAISAAFSDLDKSKRTTRVKDNTILRIDLDRPIVERGPDEVFSFDFGGFSSVSPIGLDQILENISKAKEDDKIEGILLESSFPMAGIATLDAVRKGLLDFKESGKWIISYGELYSQGGYYLASAADEIYLAPNADASVTFKGLNTNIPFYKRMLEGAGVEMQVIRGSNNQFKSAVEPYLYEEMSPSSRMQTEKWLGSIWNHMLSVMSPSLGQSVDELKAVADMAPRHFSDEALSRKLIHGAIHKDELIDRLKSKMEVDDEKDLNYVSLAQYIKAPTAPKDRKKYTPSYKKDKIAVIYAEGIVNFGKGNNGEIGADAYVKALNEARRDTTVKAIVLRVNSPGGVAIAGDMIWRETVLGAQAKPLIVSMGDVAASAGYLISANATRIYAEPSTITGSIGVFATLPNMKGLFNNKIGITFDGVKTNRYADFGEITRPMTPAEYNLWQESVDKSYADFVQVVANGRGLRPSFVDSIGQGRVWSGVDALELGLVDVLGGLEEAIEAAAELAEIEDYSIRKLPKRKDPFQQLIDDLTGETSNMILRWQFGGDEQLLRQFQQLKRAKEMTGVQAVVPYSIEVY